MNKQPRDWEKIIARWDEMFDEPLKSDEVIFVEVFDENKAMCIPLGIFKTVKDALLELREYEKDHGREFFTLIKIRLNKSYGYGFSEPPHRDLPSEKSDEEVIELIKDVCKEDEKK